MKKIVYIFLCILSIFTLAGCGEKGESNPNPKPNTPDIENPSLKYKINFYDENSLLLKSQEYEENAKVSYTYDPIDTKEYNYSFNGWLLDNKGDPIINLPRATSDANYYASVSKVKNKYSLSFDTNGGSAIGELLLEYGSKVNKPTNPTKDGFRFMGWFSDSLFKNEVIFPLEVKDNMTIYAKWQEEINLLDYLKTLLVGYKMDPWSYIPNTLKPEANIENTIVTDYNNFISVGDIKTGYGEEWAMILDNLCQSEIFYKILNVIETLSSASIVAYSNYLDTNPSDVNHFTYRNGMYTIAINFANNVISYSISFDGEVPFFGRQNVNLVITMDIVTGVRTGNVRAGESNAIKYIVEKNKYVFAIKYLNSREAYFEVSRNNDRSVSGKIYEFLHFSDKTISSTAADFYINDKYLSAVGNKASGIPGFKGYISELYNVRTGELLGYEVKEKANVNGAEIDFNTLWFNLNDILGINNIKVIKPEKPDGTNQNHIFVNNSENIFKTEKFGGLNLKSFSRRYDIELRKTYLYTFDNEKQENVRVETLVPMFFVQEEKLNDLINDVKKNNGIQIALGIQINDLEKLMDDYKVLIPKFIENKNNITREKILEFIDGR